MLPPDDISPIANTKSNHTYGGEETLLGIYKETKTHKEHGDLDDFRARAMNGSFSGRLIALNDLDKNKNNSDINFVPSMQTTGGFGGQAPPVTTSFMNTQVNDLHH